MAAASWRYWGKFAALASGSLALLFFFVFGMLPRRFLLELDFNESGFAYPVINSPLLAATLLPPPESVAVLIPRGPGERLWAEYLQLTAAGDSAAALELLRDHLERHPQDTGVRLELGRALWRYGLREEAVAEYRRVLSDKADWQVKLELAQLLVAARRWEEALSLYDDLVQLRPLDVELRTEQARVASWAERYELAAALYRELLALNPGDPQLRFEWARVLYWSGDPELAAAVLTDLPPGLAGPELDSLRVAIASALPPSPPLVTDSLEEPTSLERARALAWEGAVDSALILYRDYLREHPDDDPVLLELADLFEFRAGAPDSAMALLLKYLERHPDAYDVRLRLARLLAWSGQLAAAKAEVETLVEARPNDAAAWALLGELNRWLGERVAAARAYGRALRADPDEPTASQGLKALREQVDAELASQGSIGPAGTVEYFVDSDEYSLAQWRGAWRFGSPRARAGVEFGVERSTGFGPTGDNEALRAASIEAVGERWWLEGELHASATVGAWIPESGASMEPLLGVDLTAPDWGGGLYQLNYQHGPAHYETRTLEAIQADVRADVVALGHHRPLGERWDLSLLARAARYTGAGASNTRTDGTAGVYFRPHDHWIFGYEARGLRFSEAAPVIGRRLYWDPEWSWSNAAVVRWQGQPGPGWWLEVGASPGFAWLREREQDATVVFELGALVDVRRRLGTWTLTGSAGFSQSRADGYRALRLGLGASRGFGR